MDDDEDEDEDDFAPMNEDSHAARMAPSSLADTTGMSSEGPSEPPSGMQTPAASEAD